MNSLKRENNLLKVEIATLKNRLNMQLKQNRTKKNSTRKAITQKTIKKGTATRKNTPLVLNTENKLLHDILNQINVNNRGMIETTYGLNTIVQRGQIALAKFNNETELKSKGSNTYQATQKSGEQILGKAMASNFGKILAGSLESSNTNISMEMVNLIKTQQAFNGNARILQSNVEVTRRLMG